MVKTKVVKPKPSVKIQKKAESTQRYLDILEIKDDVVVLKDGSVRAVVLVASINFDLKSEEEQAAVISSYVQFLNAIDFPLQIVVQSRKLNIDSYLDKLKDLEKQQTNELLKQQTVEYRQYIQELVEIADIMTKRFYVVVPYSEQSGRPKRFWSRAVDAFSPTNVIHLKQKKFEEFRTELFKRVEYVIDGLASAGLKSAVLDTQSLIELYYNTYNPETSAEQHLVEVGKIQLEA
ncbi:MAG: TraC family protein [Candidatus Kerfeldbacteria bacterium]|nr:TraC family protein [Candidatus Kerfeldbacteria bacterium]